MALALRPSHGVLLAAALPALAVACGAAPATVGEPPVEAPAEFSATGNVAIDSRWWTSFDDPVLDEAIEAALSNNLDLLTAAERVEAAHTVIDVRRAGRMPTAGAIGRSSYGVPAQNGPPWAASVGLQAGYEVDLWGRVGAAVSAEQLRAEATATDYQAAAIGIAAEITTTWVRLGAAAESLALYDEQLANNRTVLEMLERRFSLGSVAAADVLRQRELVEATLQEREVVEADIEVLANQLSLLMGHAPGEDTPRPHALLSMPALPHTGLSADLLNRRPDVHSAFLRLQAADRDVASALAARYPQLNLSAGITSGGPAAEGIFREWALALAGDVFAPLFQGGRIRAEIDRAEALERAQLYAYGQTMLVALREVEDALIRGRREEQRIVRLEARLELATESAARLETRYLNGTASYLDVLSATNDLQRLSRSIVAARLSNVEQRIALYRALAGPIEAAPAATNDAQ